MNFPFSNIVKIFFLTALVLNPLSLSAEVELDYPGIDAFSVNRDLPGIPSTDIDQYKAELKAWSRKYDYTANSLALSDEEVEAYISAVLGIGYSNNEITVTVDGSPTSLGMASYTVSQQMRDIIFLKSVKSSVKSWHEKYITGIENGGGTVIGEAYDEAYNIFAAYQDYMGTDSFKGMRTNPFANTMLGLGGTSYFSNVFHSDGFLETYVEGAFLNAIENYSSTLQGANLLDNLSLSKANVLEYGINFGIGLLKESGAVSNEGSLFLSNLSTASFGVAAQGLGLMMAPGVIFYNSADYLSSRLKSSAQGGHLLNYYYFMYAHGDKSTQFLQPNGQLMDFLELKTGEVTICSDIAVYNGTVIDKVAWALCNHSYSGYLGGTNAATETELKTAYAAAQLMLIAQTVDIEHLERELVARVKLEALKDHGFFLSSSYASPNLYTLELPETLSNSSEHGQPTSVSYSYDGVDILTEYPTAVSNTQFIGSTDTVKKLQFNLDLNAETKKTTDLTVYVTYADGHYSNSRLTLTHYPQISGLSISNAPAVLKKETQSLTLEYCGDLVTKGLLDYRNSLQVENQWFNVSVELKTPEDIGNNCKRHTIEFNGRKIANDLGFGGVDLRLNVTDKTSAITKMDYSDPNDLDKDGLPDDWEVQWFGNTTSNAANDDPDKDDENNYLEYLHNTDPTKAGVLGIVDTIVLEPYQLEDGTWVDTYPLKNSVSANIIVKEGTLLVQNSSGKVRGTLTIKKAGSLSVQGGVLSVAGDLVQQGGYVILHETYEDGSLEINGNYLLNAGDVDLGDGSILITHGNFDIKDTSENNLNGGSLSMSGSSKLFVKGDFTIDSTRQSHFSGGVFDLKGNLTQKSTAEGYYSETSFDVPPDSHRLILSGDTSQTISAEDNLNFAYLELANSSSAGITFEKPFHTQYLLGNGGTVKGQLPGFNDLEADTTIVGNLEINSYISLKDYKLTIIGNLYQKNGAISVYDNNNSILLIDGDFYHQGSQLHISNGQVEVTGNYLIEGKDEITGGYLSMSAPLSKLKVHGDFTINSVGRSGFGEGILELKGDFTHKSTFDENKSLFPNYNGDSDHLTILSGDLPQTVYTDYQLIADHLQLANTSTGGINFNSPASSLYLSGNGGKISGYLPGFNSLKSDMTIVGDLKIRDTTHNLNGNKLTINGDLDQQSGSIYLYSTDDNLRVEGNYQQEGGSLDIQNGQVEITGNYLIEKDGGASDGSLNMPSPASKLTVNGDFVIDSTRQSDLSAGLFELKGDFTQRSTIDSNDSARSFYNNYDSDKTSHRTLFSGNTPQIVSIEDFTSSIFAFLQLANSSEGGITFETPTFGHYLSSNGGAVKGHLPGFNGLEADTTLVGDLKIVETSHHLNGGKLIIKGNLDQQSGAILISSENANQTSLLIEGNYQQQGGNLEIRVGELEITGNYLIEGKEKLSEGFLLMSSPSSVLRVHGDFSIDSSGQSTLLEGLFDLKGDFTQKSTANSNASVRSFDAYNQNNQSPHRIIFSGNTAQIINIEDFATSTFAHLQLANTSEDGINFATPSISQFLSSNGRAVKGYLPGFNSLEADTVLAGDLKISATTHFPNGHKLTIKGDLDHQSGMIQLFSTQNDFSGLLVEGNYQQSGGFLGIENGRVEITGDYKIEGKGEASDGGFGMYEPSSSLIVDGDFAIDSKIQSSLLSGLFELKGNFTQKSTFDSNAAYGSFYTQGSNYQISHTHRTLLSGAQPQSVSIEDYDYSTFAFLELRNPNNITMLSRVRVSQLFDHQQNLFTLSNDSELSDFADYDLDGVNDHLDAYPLDPLLSSNDRDNDGVNDNIDAFPDDPTESVDTDNDGTGNNADLDDDNDDIPDTWEIAYGLDTLDATDASIDSDDDGTSNLAEYLAGTNPQGSYSFDIDGDGTVLPLTDGLLAIRYQFGFRGDSLISNATNGTAIRTSATDIEAYIAEGQIHFDLDGDGEVLPLTDGLLLLRYLFGFRGDGLVANAVGADATRTTSDQLDGYLDSLVH